MISTAADMAHYLICHATGGRFQGKQLLTAENMAVLHTPSSSLPTTYAMGWLTATVNATHRHTTSQ